MLRTIATIAAKRSIQRPTQTRNGLTTQISKAAVMFCRIGSNDIGSSPLRISTRCYHSYPDPNEKPIVLQTRSEATKQLDKSQPEFLLHEKFKLDTLFPGTPISKGIGSSPPPETFSSKLANGITVASQDIPGLMTTIALVVRTGSGYERQQQQKQDGTDVGSSSSSTDSTYNNTGATHFLELNAFRSTRNRSYKDLIEEVEKLGGVVQCISSRENIIYVIDVLRQHAAVAMDLLADSVLNPTFPAEELDESRLIVQLQQEELPPEVFSRDLVQRAAYRNQPMGNLHFCPLELVNSITAEKLEQFRSEHFYGSNCVVAAVGLDHDTAVQLAQQKFGAMPIHGSRSSSNNSSSGSTSSSSDSSEIRSKNSGTAALLLPSQYTGGMLSETRVLKEPFVKLAMGFEAGGWQDELLVPMCVMHQLLGGGSSFSAGGPGKGMYTRLYTHVLNRHYWAESVEAFLSTHDGTGILGIDGSCPPENISNLIRVIVDQIAILALLPVPAEELSRAKNMLKSNMMMQLESRLVQCEDIARQYSTFGYRDSPALMCDMIDKVTAEDIRKLASRMMDKPPCVGCVGADLSSLPSYKDIAQFTKSFYHEAWKAHSPTTAKQEPQK